MPNVSIAVSAKDNYSTAIKRMADNTTPFRKDVQNLQKELETLSNNKYSLSVDLKKAKMELDAATKAFKKTGSASDELLLKSKTANYHNIKDNLDLVSKSARKTQKDLVDLSGTMDKAGNKQYSNTGTNKTIANTGFGALGTAGGYQMLGNTASNIASAYVGSAYGGDGATMFSSIGGGIASGMAVGSMIGGPVGTAVGGLVGAGLGAVNGATEVFTRKDEAFKGYVQNSYQDVTGEQKTILNSGSAIAASREQTQISFATLFKDENKAAEYLAEVKTMANSTPFLFDDLTSMSKVLKTYNFDNKELIPTLTTIGDTGAALGLSPQSMAETATYIGRMKSTNKSSMEYLNPLTERGIDAVGYMAQAKGISKEEMAKLLSKGKVSGEWASEAILSGMQKAFAGAMEMQSKTFIGKSSTLQGMEEDIAGAMGEGYNAERMQGIADQIDYLGGENGTKLKEANSKIGEWKAHLENEKERYIREAETDMMNNNTDYMTAKANGDGVKQGELLMKARLEGINKYNASEGAQLQLESELSIIKGVRENAALQEEYWNTGLIMGKEFERGIADARSGISEKLGPPPLAKAMNEPLSVSAFANDDINTMYNRRVQGAPGFAYGMDYVPYDNFPAYLHQGERVLTAGEARRGDSSSSNITITGNTFNIREDADVYKIATELARQLEIAREISI